MWIVFGWDKEEKPLGKVATGYCYDCRRIANWVVWNESEWATLSAIRVLRFINRNALICDGCAAAFVLSRREFRSIGLEMRRHFGNRWQPKKNTARRIRGAVNTTSSCAVERSVRGWGERGGRAVHGPPNADVGNRPGVPMRFLVLFLHGTTYP